MFKLSAVAAALVFAASSQAAVKSYSVSTAPDLVSRQVLSHTVKHVDEGASPQSGPDTRRAVHANFPQIIEQNFARLDQRGVRGLVDGLSERELHDLAQLYANAVNDGGRQARLLDVLADRLDVGRLSRLSRHFGTTEIGAAVQRAAPAKAAGFAAAAPMVVAGPVAGVAIASSMPKLSSGRAATTMGGDGLGRFLDMTPNEIYLDYRTAPTGSLGATGAIWETIATLCKGAVLAAWAGWEVGSVANGLLQTYTPHLYDTIGGTINEIVEPLLTAPVNTPTLGEAQQHSSEFFDLSPQQSFEFGANGGDFGVSVEWTDFVGGGGSGSCGEGIKLCFLE